MLALSAPALAADANAPDPNALFRDLFAQPAAEAGPQIRAILAACGNDANTLRRWIAADRGYKPYRPGWQEFSSRTRHGEKVYDFDFHVRIPRGYDPERSWPLLLAGHGQGGTGRGAGRMMEGLLGQDVEKVIIVAPTMPGPRLISTKPYQEDVFLKPLRWAQRNLNIDDDRVAISGYSQGGHMSWHLAVMYPRHFACAVPMAGIPAFQLGPAGVDMYLQNLQHQPLWGIWGERDVAAGNALGNVDLCRIADAQLKKLRNKHYTGTELPGRDHGNSFPKPEAFRTYIASHRRIGPPLAFEYVFHFPHHARAYYVEATGFRREPLDISRGHRVAVPVMRGEKPPTREELRVAMRDKLARKLYSIKVNVDPNANQLYVRGYGLKAARVYVTEGTLKPDRPAVVKYWSRRWRGTIPASARCMLEHYARRRDASRIVFNELDCDGTAKVTVRYPAAGESSP